MGRTAIYLHAVVQAGRIELAAPVGVHDGDEVDVVLLTDSPAGENSPPRSLLEILDSLPHDIGRFTSAHEVDAYVREERDSWER
jgi:hypothetical protein